MRIVVPNPVAAILVAAFLSACSSSPSSPTPTPAATPIVTTPASSFSTARGRTIDAITGAPLPSITVSLDDDGVSATTSADGAFQVTAPEAGVCSVTLSGPAVVQRQTEIRMPAADAALSLIPSQFDLGSFDQMYRSDGALHRWTTAPALVIVNAVLQFTSVSDSTFTALDERLTPEDRASMAADLGWGLPQVTGGAFGAFASVTVESPAPGQTVNFFSREGSIVVARFSGLSRGTGYWGYGRSARRSAAVVAGAIMLDRDFEVSRSVYVRSLRVHEMGHALGYCHVTSRQSFMNSSAVVEPNGFDLDATRIAFQRVPGNQAPDRDPSAQVRLAQRSGTLAWGVITP
jgi:hypothetical protein